MKANKVAIFTMSNFLSGAEKRFIRIASELSKVRNDILLIINLELFKAALNDSEINSRVNELKENKKLILLNTKEVNNRTTRIIGNFYNLYKIIKKNNIKIIHCSLGALKYTLVKKISNIKVIAEITSPDVALDIMKPKKYKNMVRYFDKVITVSEGVKDRTLENLMKINKRNLIEEVHCSKIPYFLPKPGANQFNIFEKENLIVYASRFIDRKNPILFAEAISKFLHENKSWKVAVLGKGPLEEQLRYELKSYIENGQVNVEHTKDIYGYLKRSKIFVSLIYPDNYPSQSILEAMYMKNAILATNVGNTNKLVTEKNGFLVDDYEVETVYLMLKEAVSDQDRLIEMGGQSSKLIEEKFSKNIYLEDLQAVYDSLK